jgi:hypothetical protein
MEGDVAETLVEGLKVKGRPEAFYIYTCSIVAFFMEVGSQELTMRFW